MCVFAYKRLHIRDCIQRFAVATGKRCYITTLKVVVAGAGGYGSRGLYQAPFTGEAFILISASNSLKSAKLFYLLINDKSHTKGSSNKNGLKSLLTSAEPCWASPGAKGQQSSAGGSKNQVNLRSDSFITAC